MADNTYEAIERELSTLLRIGERAALYAATGGGRLDRASIRLLRLLAEKGPMRLSALADCAGVDASTVSRQVAHLEAQGLVVREADPADRRASLLHASREGVTVLGEVGVARRKQLRQLLAAWPADDRRSLARLLGLLNTEAQRVITAPHEGRVKAAQMERAR